MKRFAMSRKVASFVAGLCAGFAASGADLIWPGTAGGDISLDSNWGDGVHLDGTQTLKFTTDQSAPLTMTASSLTCAGAIFGGNMSLAFGVGHALTASGAISFTSDDEVKLTSGKVYSSGNRIWLNGNTPRALIVENAGAILNSAPASAGGNSYICLGNGDTGRHRLVVRDGASLTGQVVMSLFGNKCVKNTVEVYGSGTTWTMNDARQLQTLYAGGNVVSISNNATATFLGDSKWGAVRLGKGNSGNGWNYSASSGDLLKVSDGAKLTCTYGIWIGEYNGNNTLEVSHGGSVQCGSDIRIGLNKNASDYYFPGSVATNSCLRATGTGNLVKSSSGVFIGYGATSQSNRLEVVENAGLTVNGPVVLGNNAANIGNVASFGAGSSTVFTNGNVSVGLSSSDNRLEIEGGSVTFAAGAALKIGVNAGANGNAVAIRNATMVLHAGPSIGGEGDGSLFEAKDSTISVVNPTASHYFVSVGASTGTATMTFRGTAFNGQSGGGTRFSCGSSTVKDVRVNVLDGSVVKTSRFITYCGTTLTVSNATLSVSEDFQPNFNDAGSSGSSIRFEGDNPGLTSSSLNSYGDCTYDFHIPREGYRLTGGRTSVVTSTTYLRRAGNKGKIAIRVFGAQGPRQRGTWTLMRVTDAKWNFTDPQGAQAGGPITAADIECGPGITPIITANEIKVRVSSQNGMCLIVR